MQRSRDYRVSGLVVRVHPRLRELKKKQMIRVGGSNPLFL